MGRGNALLPTTCCCWIACPRRSRVQMWQWFGWGRLGGREGCLYPLCSPCPLPLAPCTNNNAHPPSYHNPNPPPNPNKPQDHNPNHPNHPNTPSTPSNKPPGTTQAALEERVGEVGELREELKEAVKREGQKSLELARVQQDLLLAQKAQATLKAERDDLGKKVGLVCWGEQGPW